MGLLERNRLIELAKDSLLENEKAADGAVNELFMLYDEAAYSIENRVAALVGRFADQNGLSQAEARKLLEGKEYSRWRMGMEEYLEKMPKEAAGTRLQLELNTLAMKSRVSREEQLLGEVYKNMAEMAENAGDGLRDSLSDVYRTNYARGMYNVQSSLRLGFNIAKIDEKHLLQVLNWPWQQRTFSANLWGKADVIAGHLRRELTLGFIKGSGVPEMARNIRAVFGRSRYEAERLVRTECKYFANQGELAGYRENGVTKYKYIGGSEGSHKCECAFWNGKVIKVDEAKPGENFPPLHPNCLCIVVAHFDNDIFSKRKDAVPLAENVKFLEWKKKYAAEGSVKGPLFIS